MLIKREVRVGGEVGGQGERTRNLNHLEGSGGFRGRRMKREIPAGGLMPREKELEHGKVKDFRHPAGARGFPFEEVEKKGTRNGR